MAQQAVEEFPADFEKAYRSGAGRKLGLSEHQEADTALFDDLLSWMQEEKVDFTLTFRRLVDLAAKPETSAESTVAGLYQFPESIQPWMTRWQQRTQLDTHSARERQQLMYQHSPAIIPRNHLVERAIENATDNEDFAFFHRLVEVTAQPQEYSTALEEFARPPQASEIVYQTFCGT